MCVVKSLYMFPKISYLCCIVIGMAELAMSRLGGLTLQLPMSHSTLLVEKI